jgi:hypothetical protein
MPIEVQLYADGTAVRHDWSETAEGEKIRRFQKSTKQGRTAEAALHSAFSFSERDWARLRSAYPKLFEPDPVKRGRAWMRFAQSTEGRFFRGE